MVTRTKKIFVGGLSAPTTLEDVKNYFEQFGPVSRYTPTKTLINEIKCNDVLARCLSMCRNSQWQAFDSPTMYHWQSVVSTGVRMPRHCSRNHWPRSVPLSHHEPTRDGNHCRGTIQSLFSPCARHIVDTIQHFAYFLRAWPPNRTNGSNAKIW